MDILICALVISFALTTAALLGCKYQDQKDLAREGHVVDDTLPAALIYGIVLAVGTATGAALALVFTL